MDNQRKRICIFDIDGVLNYYPDCYVDFVNKKLGKDYKNLYEVKSYLPYNIYKSIKEEYRLSGIKQNLEVREHAKQVLKELKDKGYYIIILSSRPVDKYNVLIIQTTNWLKKNGLEYDYLTFGENKHLEIIQKFGNVSFVVEDNRSFANDIAEHGYRVYLLDNLYNQGGLVRMVERIKNIRSVLLNA